MKFKASVLTASSITAVLLVSSAVAHHGWSWASDDQTQISGTVLEVIISPPHPSIRIQTATDGEWRVDLGNPVRTRNAGFVDGDATVGDSIQFLGHRSTNSEEKLFKAVRATLDGRNYDFYPEMIED